jgi:hypothetical protein
VAGRDYDLQFAKRGVRRRRIRLIEDTAKSLRLKSDSEMDFAAAVYLFEYIHIPQYFFTGEGGGEAEF